MLKILKYSFAAGLPLCAGNANAAPLLIHAIGVESQYADVIAQIGGQYVAVSAIETNPDTDPHSFEASPKIAGQIAAADLVVENGLGYDDWAGRIISATPNASRKIINAQILLNLPYSTPNPHLWYSPATMPAVAKAIAADLTAIDPAQADYFQANLTKFETALKPWNNAMAAFKLAYPGTPVAVTEPVANYLLTVMGIGIATSFSLQAAVMNGTDPAPQDITAQDNLLTSHKVKMLIYNQQVTDPLTQSMLALAKQNGIPVVGVYETMPVPGYNYQSWMLAAVAAISTAAQHP